jgi:hypothetical protein
VALSSRMRSRSCMMRILLDEPALRAAPPRNHASTRTSVTCLRPAPHPLTYFGPFSDRPTTVLRHR